MKIREIKFRGQRIDNNEFVIGCYVIDPDLNSRIYLKPFEDASSNTYYFVKEETVSQFTGLVDKNGKEIFEGDIVLPLQNDDLSQMIFINGSFKIAKKLKNGNFVIFNYFKDSIEVKGNIFENPELL